MSSDPGTELMKAGVGLMGAGCALMMVGPLLLMGILIIGALFSGC